MLRKIMKKDLKLVDYFPFPEIRPAQDDALAAIEKAHATKKKFVILEIPKGGGKSGIAVAAAKWAKEALGGGTYILSPQKTLTAQYTRDFSDKGIKELRGRNSYQCRDFHTDCERGNILRKDRDDQCQHCPYRAAKDEVISGTFGVTNFSYYLSEMQHAGKLGKRSLLILDEGHNTEALLLNETDIQIKQKQLFEYGIQKVPAGSSVKHYKEWAEKVAKSAIQSYIQEESKLEHSDSEAQIASFRKISSAQTMSNRLSRFLNAENELEWVAWTDRGVITIKPLSPKAHAGRLLFDHADMVIIMSATILDLKTFTRGLGISLNECEYLALPSDFTVQNRLIHYHPIGSMSFKNQGNTLPSIGDYVRRLLGDVHPNVKGIIHTHTKKINEFLVNSLRDWGSRIITYTDSRDRDQAVHAHINSRNPTVLLTPGMTEGLDLKDDLSRFQIICKVPYPPLNHYNDARMKVDPAWYQWRTALTLVQATGRSIRSKTDYAATYVLDSDFGKFVAMNRSTLPSWWLEAIRWPKKTVPPLTAPKPEPTESFF
jgi:ATP-dependent DNA helicase DinG